MPLPIWLLKSMEANGGEVPEPEDIDDEQRQHLLDCADMCGPLTYRIEEGALFVSRDRRPEWLRWLARNPKPDPLDPVPVMTVDAIRNP